MKFKIENERLRIRRHGAIDYSYEIPELDLKVGGWNSAKAALKQALLAIEYRQPSAEYQKLASELGRLQDRRSEIMKYMDELEQLPAPPVADLLEQRELCERAIGMLNYDEDQTWGVKVKMVGFYDQGDTDEDGDRDFIVSYTW